MKLKFTVTGMTCAACSARVEKVTAAVSGVEKAEVNLLGGTMAVTAADTSVVEPIIKAVVQAGYGASLAGERRGRSLLPCERSAGRAGGRLAAAHERRKQPRCDPEYTVP